MVPMMAGPVALVGPFARERECVRQALMELDCSVCSLSSLTNASQKAFLVWTSCVPSQVSSTVAALLEEEDTRRLYWNRARVVP